MKKYSVNVPVNVFSMRSNAIILNTNNRHIEPWPIEPYHYSFDIKNPTRNKVRKVKLLQQPRNDNSKYTTDAKIEYVPGESGMIFNFMFNSIIEEPDWFRKHKNKVFPRVMCIDIETESWHGRFPTPGENKILMIGYKLLWKDKKPSILDIGKIDNEDEDIIRELIRIIKQEKVDIITTYNGRYFDIPYIAARLNSYMTDGERHDIGESYYMTHELADDNIKHIIFLAKEEEENNVLSNERQHKMIDAMFVRKNRDMILHSPGFLLHYDILYTNVRHRSDLQNRITYRDASLGDLKSRSLKDVSRFYGYDPIQLDSEEMGNTGSFYMKDKVKFKEYLESDINATEHLFNVYFYANLELAEYTNAPLNYIIDREDGTLASILLERELRKKNILPLKKNNTKYPDYFTSSESSSSFQAALVSIKKTGFFPKLYKVDFSGQYPSAMRTFNISPETVMEAKKYIAYKKSTDRLLDKKMLDDSKFQFHRMYWSRNKRDTLFLAIPDEGYGLEHDEGRLVYLAIDQEEDGVTRKMLDELTSQRKEIKRLMNETKDPYEKKLYDSKQQAIKIMSNSIFGIISNEHSKQSNILCGIAITGICRWLSNWVFKTYLKDITCEIDTDGLITCERPDVDMINEGIANIINQKMGVPKDKIYMKMDFEEFEYGYIYAAKNYIFYKKDKAGNLKEVKHGNGLKSSKMPAIFDRAVRIMIEQTFQNKYGSFQNACKEAHNIIDLPIDDFVQNMVLKYDPSHYKTAIPWAYDIIEELATKGYNITKGDQIQYVRSINSKGYSSNIYDDKLDYREYHRIIDTVIQTFSKDQENKSILI